jgi:hypothetical protein
MPKAVFDFFRFSKFEKENIVFGSFRFSDKKIYFSKFGYMIQYLGSQDDMDIIFGFLSFF